MAKQKTSRVPKGMTMIIGFYNGKEWPIQLVLYKLNVNLHLRPGEFIIGRDGRKINDPFFEAFVGLSRELSDVPVPIISIPAAVSERRETTS